MLKELFELYNIVMYPVPYNTAEKKLFPDPPPKMGKKWLKILFGL
jgi:hypothetical protein